MRKTRAFFDPGFGAGTGFYLRDSAGLPDIAHYSRSGEATKS